MNDFNKYNKNSRSLINDTHDVYKKERKKKKSEIPKNPMMLLNQHFEENQKNENQIDLDKKSLNKFYSNLLKDRFQFLREKFNKIPILFYHNRNKTDIKSLLKEIDNSVDSVEDVFEDIYKSFLSDSLDELDCSQNNSQNIYLRLNSNGENVSCITYNFEQLFKEDSEFKSEFLSFFYQHFIKTSENLSENIYTLAKTFNLKLPLIKSKIAVQGIANSFSIFEAYLDEDEFHHDLLKRNNMLHLSILNSMISFLLSYNYS